MRTVKTWSTRVGVALFALMAIVMVVSLWAQEPRMENRGITAVQGNIVSARGVVFSGGGLLRDFRTATAEATAGSTVYTTAEVLSGLITRTVTGIVVNDSLPTAASLATAMPGVIAGTSMTTLIDMGTSTGTMILNTASTGVTYGQGCGTALSSGDTLLVMITYTSTTAYRATCINVGT